MAPNTTTASTTKTTISHMTHHPASLADVGGGFPRHRRMRAPGPANYPQQVTAVTHSLMLQSRRVPDTGSQDG